MKIKVNFTVPTKDFKRAECIVLPVTCNFDPESVLNTDFEYSMVIPDYIFNELADSEPRFSTTYDHNNHNIFGLFSDKSLTRKFKKTQTAFSIRSLISYMSELTGILNDKYSIETETTKKKIFIQFDYSQTHTTNNLNGAYQGEAVKQNFKYFIGYEMMTTKFRGSLTSLFDTTPKKKYFTRIEYHSQSSSQKHKDTGFNEVPNLTIPLNGANESTEAFEKRFSIIDWTEEREQYCEQVKQTFINVNQELSNFLKDLDNDKFDRLVIGQQLTLKP